MSSIAEIFDLGGRVAVVTGAADGLGFEIGDAFAGAGACVVFSDIDEAKLERAVQSVRDRGGDAIAVKCDVTSEAEVETLFAATQSHFGQLDILVNNAGIADPEPARIHEYSSENWRKVQAVNLDGIFYCCRQALKLMLPNRSGKIINVASMWGLAGASSVFPIPAYNATKGAVVNLTRETALEYASDNVQVNALCPGFYRTGLAGGAYDNPDFVSAITAFTPMGRVAEASEIRGPAVFLASSASDYITGIALLTDGGCMAK